MSLTAFIAHIPLLLIVGGAHLYAWHAFARHMPSGDTLRKPPAPVKRRSPGPTS